MAFSNPRRNVGHLTLVPGDRVADFGAGSGYHSIPLAEFVGPAGRVYAIDIQRDLLERALGHAKEQGFDNVEIITSNLEKERGSMLPDEHVSGVIASNVLFQTENPEKLIREMARVLRSGGRALVIDWKDSYNNLGPRPRDIFPQHAAHPLCESCGLRLVGEVPVGDHHWGLLFQKQ